MKETTQNEAEQFDKRAYGAFVNMHRKFEYIRAVEDPSLIPMGVRLCNQLQYDQDATTQVLRFTGTYAVAQFMCQMTDMQVLSARWQHDMKAALTSARSDADLSYRQQAIAYAYRKSFAEVNQTASFLMDVIDQRQEEAFARAMGADLTDVLKIHTDQFKLLN